MKSVVDERWSDEPVDGLVDGVVDGFPAGDVVRLMESASYGWAGLRRWVLDRGTAAAAVGEVRQQPGTRGYRLRRMASGTRRLGRQPAGYEVRDTSGALRLRVEVGAAPRGLTAPATLSGSGLAARVPAVPAHPLGVGLTVTGVDGAPLLVVPDEWGTSWSALDPSGRDVARVEHVAPRAGWIDPRNRRGGSPLTTGRAARPEVDLRAGDVLTFPRTADAATRLLVLGVAICRAHRRS